MVANPLSLMAALVAGLIPILPRAAPKALIACWLAMVEDRNAQRGKEREFVEEL
jgi:hypothetical protein